MSMTQQSTKTEEKKTRGGARPGAGRKKKRLGSVVVRVPEQYAKAIKSLIHELNEMSESPSKTQKETEFEYIVIDDIVQPGSVALKHVIRKYWLT